MLLLKSEFELCKRIAADYFVVYQIRVKAFESNNLAANGSVFEFKPRTEKSYERANIRMQNVLFESKELH